MKTILLVSGILGLLANIPYMIEIIKTRNTANPMTPSRVSWIIWAILDLLIIFSSLSNGKDLYEIALPIGYAIGAIAVAILAIPYGEWGNIKEARNIFIGSFIGVLIWLFAGSELALYSFVTTLWMSAYPTIKKIWVNPTSEPKLPWTIWFIAASLSIFTLGNLSTWTLIGSIVPVTYLGMNIPIMYSMYIKNK